MKKICRTDRRHGLLVALLYSFAVWAVLAGDPPALFEMLAVISLIISWYHHCFIADRVVQISVLNDKKTLLKSARERWIPVEITCLYYSGLGQVVYCREFAGYMSGRFMGRQWVAAKMLPGDASAANVLRNERCQLLAQLAEPGAGDNTVSRASGSRSGTSMLK